MNVKSLDDTAAGHRMEFYMTPDDLNTEACVELAGEILSGLADELSETALRATKSPTRCNLDALAALRRLYRSDYFKALSAGVADGDAVCRHIIRNALMGRTLRTEVSV